MLATALAALLLAPPIKEVKNLPADFNAAPREVRLLLVLSPTSPRGARTARRVQTEILDPLIGLPIRTFIVWTPVLPGDDRKAAEAATRNADSFFVTHYWDATRTIAKEIGERVKLPAGRQVAWDCVFVFDPKVAWAAKVPQEKLWMHQFGRDEREFDPVALRTEVDKMARALRP
jgi:hypothetical protein